MLQNGAYASSSGLVGVVDGLETKQQDQWVERRGPALSTGFEDQGQPTKAVQGYARACGVEVVGLETLEAD